VKIFENIVNSNILVKF